MKLLKNIFATVIVFSAFISALSGCGESNRGVSVTGVEQSQDTLFSAESVAEVERQESAQRHAQEHKAVPFQKAPPPAELPASEKLLPEPVFQGPVLPEPGTSVQAPSLTSNFIGITDDNTVIPPDTMGAAGPLHLVSILNNAVAFFDKSTGVNLNQVSLQNFWSSLGTAPGQPASNVFDPQVIYDQYSGRFIAITLGYDGTLNSSWLLIAVSATSDPTGTWYKWAIDADKDGAVQTGNWADFTGLGVDNGYVYAASNMFTRVSNIWQYSKMWVIEKAQLLNGATPITWTEFASPPGSGFTLQPAHVFGASSIQYVVHQGYFIAGPPLRRLIRLASITFPGAIPTWTDLGYIEVDTYPAVPLPLAPQLGASQRIETNDQRIMNAVFRNGYIWATHTVADNSNSKTEIAWYQIDPASASFGEPYGMPVQQGRINDDDRWYYFPSIAVNSRDDAGIGFSGSSAGEYAGGYYTGRQSADAPGTMQSVALLKAGAAPYSKEFGSGRNRWGDYSATVVDPEDDLTFWTIQEYADIPFGGFDRWGTWWGKFRFLYPPEPPGNLLSSTVSTSRVDLSWTDNSDNEEGFSIERRTGSGGTYSEIVSVSADVTSYSNTGLNESTTYFYRIRAFNSDGSSAYSNESVAVTLPAAPGNLSATAVSASRINLNWTDNSGGEEGFSIERRTGSGGAYSGIVSVSADVTSYSNTGLNESTTYFYRVRAFNSTGNSAYSNEAFDTTPASTGGGGGGGGGCSIGAGQNTPTALAGIAVMLMPLLFMAVLRKKTKCRPEISGKVKT